MLRKNKVCTWLQTDSLRLFRQYESLSTLTTFENLWWAFI